MLSQEQLVARIKENIQNDKIFIIGYDCVACQFELASQSKNQIFAPYFQNWSNNLRVAAERFRLNSVVVERLEVCAPVSDGFVETDEDAFVFEMSHRANDYFDALQKGEKSYMEYTIRGNVDLIEGYLLAFVFPDEKFEVGCEKSENHPLTQSEISTLLSELLRIRNKLDEDLAAFFEFINFSRRKLLGDYWFS